jgi:release factor glutamine methyltransferase
MKISTIRQAQSFGTAQLLSTSETPALDTDILLAHTLNKPKEFLFAHPEYHIPTEILQTFTHLIHQRRDQTPIAYLIGEKAFYNHSFIVSPHTLIPRPETEMIVEMAIDILKTEFKDKRATVIDVGTGSGCIILSIAHEVPNHHFIGIDISPHALDIARKNQALLALQTSVTFIQANLLATPNHLEPDIIVANLPYISTKEYQSLDNGIKKEPRVALLSATNGKSHYMTLFNQIARQKQKPKHIIIEIGHTQARELSTEANTILPQYTTTVINDIHQKARVIHMTRA